MKSFILQYAFNVCYSPKAPSQESVLYAMVVRRSVEAVRPSIGIWATEARARF